MRGTCTGLFQALGEDTLIVGIDRRRESGASPFLRTCAALSVLVFGITTQSAWAEFVRYPVRDGTLVDGAGEAVFDGQADEWDWSFDESGYEGTISRTVTTRDANIEHRVFWKYNLAGVTWEGLVSATLTFTVRGNPAYPFPDSEIHVYAYPSGLWEMPSDFHIGPADLQGDVTIVAYQPPTEYTLDVSAAVNEALGNGDSVLAFRFQVAPDTSSVTAQAFIDALDSNVETKPYLIISDAIPGDTDGDDDVDLTDFELFMTCMGGPDIDIDPTCDVVDLQTDRNVDLRDFFTFQKAFSGSW